MGTPREVYHKPANIFVAGFIGSLAMNLIGVNAGLGNTLQFHWGGGIVWQGEVPAQPGAALTLGLRPDRLMLVASEQAQATSHVTTFEHLGDATILGVRRFNSALSSGDPGGRSI